MLSAIHWSGHSELTYVVSHSSLHFLSRADLHVLLESVLLVM